jgi:phage terminase large subunit-like protein
MDFRPDPTYHAFLRLCEEIGFEPEAHQRKIAKAALESRELLVLLPRGNGKSRLVGTLAVHHLLSHPEPRIYLAAASRDQARVVFEYARATAEDIDRVVIRHLELRVPSGFLRVLASDAPKLHGIHPTLAVIDEMQAFKDGAVYEALRTGLLEDSQLWTITTAGQGAESPLGRLRARALAGSDVRHRGAFTDARNGALRMLEWAVDEDRSITDSRIAKGANPASWISRAGLTEQRKSLPETAYRRFHLNQWVARMGSWLPPGAWQECANGKVEIPEGSRIWVGVDIGGARADTAIVWLDETFHVGCRIWSGDEALMDATAFLPELAKRYRIAEVVYDPWRAQMLAKIAEAHRIKVTAFPQSDARMIPASRALHEAITQRRIHHPADPKLNEHVAAAVARHGRRGWRIAQAERGANVDGVIALAMAYDAATTPPPPQTEVFLV